MMKNWLAAVLLTAVLSLPTYGALIDFETDPSGAVPVDDAALSRFDSYSVDGVNVNFGFDTNLDGTVDTDGLFEIIGDEGGGFPSNSNGFSSAFGIDTAAPGFEPQLGTWFLRAPDHRPANFGKFIITYDTPVTALGGEVWDIDGIPGPGPNTGTEQWILRVFNGANVEIDSLTSPLGATSDPFSRDGKPWVFGLNNLAGAVRVEFEYIGTKTRGVGFSFNSYNATIPEPGTLSLLAFGGLLLLRRGR